MGYAHCRVLTAAVVMTLASAGCKASTQEWSGEFSGNSQPREEAHVTEGTAPSGSDLYDPRLIGVWRTEVIVSDPVQSFSQDLFLEFRADGVMLQRMGGGVFGGPDGSVTGAGGEVEQAAWRSVGDQIHLRIQNHPWAQLGTFYVEGPSLLLMYFDGDRKVWTRM